MVSQQQGTRVAAALYLASSCPILLHLHPLPASLVVQRAFVQCISCAVNSMSCRYVRGGSPLPFPLTSVAPARSVSYLVLRNPSSRNADMRALKTACLSPLPRHGARLCSQVTFSYPSPGGVWLQDGNKAAIFAVSGPNPPMGILVSYPPSVSSHCLGAWQGLTPILH